MSLNPRVAIVIVNWNKKDYVLNLLEQLQNIDYDNYEIIVVDNASTDGSPDSIREKYPNTQLIINSENLGGTGGFNTGIRHALAKGEFKYLWLLDNDAVIEKTTLVELVKVMESDSQIGIAGSRIVDTEEKDMTVALGGLFKWNTIGVTPFYRNKRGIDEQNPKEVDYVAICSALVRVQSLDKVGLMDERLFFFWDDMDWGLTFKDNGFKVMAVPQSVVYHPSFTEKRRGQNTDYYGIRNSLLVYTKHTGMLKRFLIFYNYFRYLCKGVIFGLLNRREKQRGRFIALDALKDFCSDNWGKYGFNEEENQVEIHTRDIAEDKSVKDVLVVAGDIKENMLRLNGKVKEVFPRATVTLLVRNDREDVFKPYFGNIIPLDSKRLSSTFYNVWVFTKILFSGFDVVVSPTLSPFTFAVRKSYFYDLSIQMLRDSDRDFSNVHKLILSTLLGELASLLVTPLIYFKSFRYNKASL
jgi:GT2 family glycosyltransferase